MKEKRIRIAPLNSRLTGHEGGLTLVEMSIALVIIALVVGGIVVGQQLMSAASIRADISQVQQLTASVRTFKQKYLCLPGDCRNASSFGWRPNASNTYNNGDGNESIARNNGVPTECINFWHHLGKAGFIADAYKGNDGNGGGCSGQGISPPIANGKGWVATIGPAGGSAYASASTEGRLGNLFYLSGRRQSDGYYFPIYTAIEAYNIDAKVDDGFPVSGLIRTGQVYHSIGATDGSYWTDGCVILPGNIYDVRGLYVQDNGPLETTRNPDSRDCMIAWGRAY